MEIVFDLPNKETPGYLRRMRDYMKFQESQADTTLSGAERMELMITFLMSYVKEPANKTEAMEALLDATQEQIDGLFALIMGRGETIPPVNGES
jgi:hypothetical protein